MNPWKLIGWIVLALVLLLLSYCAVFIYSVGKSQDADPVKQAQRAMPEYRVKIISVTCEDNYGRNKATITVQNTGNMAIPDAKVFMNFQDGNGSVLSTDDSYFRPSSIPPGSLSSAKTYAAEGSPQADKCAPAAIQDGAGNPVSID